MSEYTANIELNDSKESQLMNERKPLVFTESKATPEGDKNDSNTWSLV